MSGSASEFCRCYSVTVPVTPPVPHDIEVLQGATFTMEVSWVTDEATPQPISLSGRRAHMQIRSKVGGSGLLLAELSSEGTDPDLVKEPDGVVGRVDVRVPATVTAALKKKCYYDLFVISETDPGDAVRLVNGTVFVSLSATKEVRDGIWE